MKDHADELDWDILQCNKLNEGLDQVILLEIDISFKSQVVSLEMAAT